MLLYICDMLPGHGARLPCWESRCSIREMQTHALTAILPQKPSPEESWVCVRGCSWACSPVSNWEKCGKRLSHLQMKFLDPWELIRQVKAILSWRVDVVNCKTNTELKTERRKQSAGSFFGASYHIVFFCSGCEKVDGCGAKEIPGKDWARSMPANKRDFCF